MKPVEKYQMPNIEPPAQIFFEPKDKTFRTEFDGKKILSLDLKDIKSALNQFAMHKVTSNWTPMIIVRLDPSNNLSFDVKFFGLIETTGSDDQVVVSDIIQDSPDPSSWRPSMHYKPWGNESNVKLMPYSNDRLSILNSVDSILRDARDKVLDTLMGESGITFIDDMIKDNSVIFEVMKS